MSFFILVLIAFPCPAKLTPKSEPKISQNAAQLTSMLTTDYIKKDVSQTNHSGLESTKRPLSS